MLPHQPLDLRKVLELLTSIIFSHFQTIFSAPIKKKKVHFKLPMQELDEFMRLLGGSLLIAY